MVQRRRHLGIEFAQDRFHRVSRWKRQAAEFPDPHPTRRRLLQVRKRSKGARRRTNKQWRTLCLRANGTDRRMKWMLQGWELRVLFCCAFRIPARSTQGEMPDQGEMLRDRRCGIGDEICADRSKRWILRFTIQT